ncbi:MAG: uroporphyrinogen-III C-methyltransferase [Sulfuricellaceae bacterium]|nr:uroporphyrinogen-III C-methyltransferase [Sulfuricellaceae bacterium]
MSVEQESPAPSTAEASVEKTTEPPIAASHGVRINISLVVALLALALAATAWLDGRQRFSLVEHDLGKHLAEIDSQNQQSKLMAEQAQESTREMAVKLGLLESKQAEAQNQRIALDELYQEMSRNRDEWALSEIEQLLVTANEQLQLAGNVKGALIALQTADSRLQRLDRPQLLPLRKAIMQDMQRLQSLPMVDLPGISLHLDDLAASVADLPLAIDATAKLDKQPVKTPPEKNLWLKLGHEAWQDLKQLVQIRNMENPDAPLLNPSQTYFLRENLKLRLLTARLALLQHDDAGFRRDLNTVETTLNRYFDVKSAATRAAMASLKQLQAGVLTVEMPDLSTSLNALRNLKRGGR